MQPTDLKIAATAALKLKIAVLHCSDRSPASRMGTRTNLTLMVARTHAHTHTRAHTHTHTHTRACEREGAGNVRPVLRAKSVPL